VIRTAIYVVFPKREINSGRLLIYLTYEYRTVEQIRHRLGLSNAITIAHESQEREDADLHPEWG
jgi:hypothetical protein